MKVYLTKEVPHPFTGELLDVHEFQQDMTQQNTIVAYGWLEVMEVVDCKIKRRAIYAQSSVLMVS